MVSILKEVDSINFETTLQPFLAVGSLFQKEVDSGWFSIKVCGGLVYLIILPVGILSV